MTDIERIRDFLAQPRLAIVGVSREPLDFSRRLLREFRQAGYDTVAVNPEIQLHGPFGRVSLRQHSCASSPDEGARGESTSGLHLLVLP